MEILTLTQDQLNKMIERAREAGACEDELEFIESLAIKEILTHPDLPHWCGWYAYKVLEQPWPEAEDVIRIDPDAAASYAFYILGLSKYEARQWAKKR